MESILIEHGVVVTLDTRRRVIRDGAVMIEGSEITDVGKTDELHRKHAPEQVIDASRKLVIPASSTVMFTLRRLSFEAVPTMFPFSTGLGSMCGLSRATMMLRMGESALNSACSR